MRKNETRGDGWLLLLGSLLSGSAAYVMFTQSGALVFEMLGFTRERLGPAWSVQLGLFTSRSASPVWLAAASVLALLGLAALYCLRRRMPAAGAMFCIACGHEVTGRISKPCAECGSRAHVCGGVGGVTVGLRGLNILCGFVAFLFLAAALAPWCAGLYIGTIPPGDLWLIVFASTGNLLAGWLLVRFIRTLWLYGRQERLKRSTPRCDHCGYNLTGNVTGRCPECGTPCPAPVGAGERT